MAKEQPDYISYLLRLWRSSDVSSGGKATWRASLENPHTGERTGFASLDALCHFLRQQTATASGSEDKGGSDSR